MAHPLELHGREFGQVGQPLDRWSAGASLEPGGEGLGEKLRPGRSRKVGCGVELLT